MKFNKITLAMAAALTLTITQTACGDLDAEPQGDVVTAEQKQEAIAADPSKVAAGVSGIFASLNTYMTVYSSAHCDFGWPATMFGMEAAGQDMVTYNTGYNWFSSWAQRNFGNTNNYPNNLSWYHAYKIILAANTVMDAAGDDVTEPLVQLYAAQALAERAYIYFHLVQLYQQTYVGHEDAPGVPIITNKNAAEAGADGCVRAPLSECYAQILSDLDTAIKYLSECGLGVDVMATIGAKRYISLGTAYGIRARVNLTMNRWSEAESDARNAIANGNAVPATIAQVSKPTFGSMDEPNWMWGIYLSENDRVVTSGIVNWASFMGSLNYGYASVGAWVRINQNLYNSIPGDDVRLGWWLDGEGRSANLNAQQAAYVAAKGMPGYTQVKFMPYDNVLGTSTNAGSIPLMRVEEMYYIVAEAQAQSGALEAAKTTLTDFVTTYRNPSYVCDATTKEALVDEIWRERRVELWGEGISYYDLLRLNKGIDRRGSGFEEVWVYDIPAPLPSLLIPEREVENNKLLGGNNPTWSKPTSVAQ